MWPGHTGKVITMIIQERLYKNNQTNAKNGEKFMELKHSLT